MRPAVSASAPSHGRSAARSTNQDGSSVKNGCNRSARHRRRRGEAADQRWLRQPRLRPHRPGGAGSRRGGCYPLARDRPQHRIRGHAARGDARRPGKLRRAAAVRRVHDLHSPLLQVRILGAHNGRCGADPGSRAGDNRAIREGLSSSLDRLIGPGGEGALSSIPGLWPSCREPPVRLLYKVTMISKAPAPDQPRNPLHGVTLQSIVTTLVAHYGWAGLAERIPLRCFINEPSVASSLKFLRRTPWAREKVESLYLSMDVDPPKRQSGALPARERRQGR